MTDKNLTPASFWRKNYEEGIEVEMPDGAIVQLRPTLDVGFLVATGRIPDSLTSIALDGINFDPKAKNAVSKLGDALKQYDELLRIVCTEAWIHPRIVDNPKADDEISPNWLTKEQKDYTWTLIQLPVSEWKSFRQKYLASMELVPNGAATKPPAERPVKHK